MEEPIIKIHEASDYLLILLELPETKTVFGKIDICKERNDLYLGNLFVKEEYRKQGYSKKLFEILFDRLQSPEYMCYSKISLDVLPINDCDIDWLIDYYKKIGFQIVNKYKIVNQSTHMEYCLD